jgi:hypothetical protein
MFCLNGQTFSSLTGRTSGLPYDQLMQADLGSTSPKARLLAIATARRKITSPVNSSGDSFSLDGPCPRFTPAFRPLGVAVNSVEWMEVDRQSGETKDGSQVA